MIAGFITEMVILFKHVVIIIIIIIIIISHIGKTPINILKNLNFIDLLKPIIPPPVI